MELKNNKKGSALVWAVAATLILAILIAGLLSVSMAYSNRSLKEQHSREAYLAARSAVDMISSHIDGYEISIYQVDAEGNAKELTPAEIKAKISQENQLIGAVINTNEDQIVELEDFKIEGNNFGGDVTATIQRKAFEGENSEDSYEIWTVTAHAAVGGQTESVTADIKFTQNVTERIYQEVPESVNLEEVFYGMYVNTFNYGWGSGSYGSSELNITNADLYVRNLNEPSGGLSWKDENRKINFYNGTIYTPYALATNNTVFVGNRSTWGNRYRIGLYYTPASILGNGGVTDFHVLAPTSDVTGILDSDGEAVAMKKLTSSPTLNTGANFFYVEGSLSIDIDNFNRSDAQVYVFVKDGATLTLNASSSKAGTYQNQGELHIYCAQGGKVVHGAYSSAFFGMTKRVLQINGSMNADRFEIPDRGIISVPQFFNLNYKAPSSDYSVVFENAGTTVIIDEYGTFSYKWTLVNYD